MDWAKRFNIDLTAVDKTMAAFRSVEKNLGLASERVEALNRKFSEIGGVMQRVGTVMTAAVTAPLVAVGKGAVDAASKVEEMRSALNQTFGADTAGVQAWADTTAKALGRSRYALEEQANAFGLLFTKALPSGEAAKLSQTFATLAQDLSSFFNVSEADALQKLMSGLSGESEPLRQFGVFLSEAAVEAKAMELGLQGVNGKLTEQQKIQARAALILQETTKAQGDVVRTSDGYANSVRAMSAAWSDLVVKIGQELLPVATKLAQWLTDTIRWVEELDPSIIKFGVNIAAFGAAIGPVAIAAGVLAAGIGLIGAPLAVALAGFVVVTAAIMAFWPRIRALGEWLAKEFPTMVGNGLRAMFDGLEAVIKWVGEKITAFVSAIAEKIPEGVRLTQEAMAAFSGWLGEVFGAAVQGAVDIWQRLVEGFNAAVEAVGRVTAAIADMVTKSLGYLQQLVEGVQTWLVDKFNGAVNQVTQSINRVTEGFRVMWDKVVGNSYVPDMVDGVTSEFARMNKAMTSQTTDATGGVDSMFAGLLSEVINAAQSGGDIMEVFKNRLIRIADQMLDRALEPLGNAFSSLFSGGGAMGGRTGALKNTGGGGGLFGWLGSLVGSFFGGAFADGGRYPVGKPILVGEQGPEIVKFGQSGTVIPARETAAMLGGGGQTVVYNIDARGADVGAVARIETALRQMDREFGRRAQVAVRTGQMRSTV